MVSLLISISLSVKEYIEEKWDRDQKWDRLTFMAPEPGLQPRTWWDDCLLDWYARWQYSEGSYLQVIVVIKHAIAELLNAHERLVVKCEYVCELQQHNHNIYVLIFMWIRLWTSATQSQHLCAKFIIEIINLGVYILGHIIKVYIW